MDLSPHIAMLDASATMYDPATSEIVSPALSGRPVLGSQAEGDVTHFGLWCTTASTCAVRFFSPAGKVLTTVPMQPRGDGYFGIAIAGKALVGSLYKFVLGETEVPDPCARFLPQGVHGPAMVTDSRYPWKNSPVPRRLSEHVIYELHVGTFTNEGTYAATEGRLPELVRLGITALELMPLAAFPGRRGWGYEGVALYAPFAPYGTPDQLKHFVDAAHGLGLSVFLDVVYNHYGPAGNFLPSYSSDYFTSAHKNAWGDSPNFACPSMRRHVIDNALYWLDDFQFDGLRLDATHAIFDRSSQHILAELADAVAALTPKRLLIAEDERNDPALLETKCVDGVWADDFHHATRVTLTGETDGYFAAYKPGSATIADTINRRWLFEGEIYPPSGKPRGKPARHLSPEQFIYCLQNHDQVGNRAFGDRLMANLSPDLYAAASTLLLFLPMTPLLFMGQEWGATTPFQFFTDQDGAIGRAISEGRREEFKKFSAFSDPNTRKKIPDPQEEETFRRSKLNWSERERSTHATILSLYQRLLALRRTDPVLREMNRGSLQASGAGAELRVVRSYEDESRLLLVNWGNEELAVDLAATSETRILFDTANNLDPSRLSARAARILAGPRGVWDTV